VGVGDLLNNSTILVTGGTGSFGNAFIKKVFKDYSPKKLIVYSRDEHKQNAMKKLYSELYAQDKLRFFIGDVRDKERLMLAFSGVDYVIHAAALKDIMSCTYNPNEAVKTNVIGSMNIIEAARERSVKKVIFVSTDKSCYPINLYGYTKGLSERVFQAGQSYMGGKETVISIVRYGNVAGSTGSVIPLFKKLLAEGKQLTVTDKAMTRFWITLEEAIELVYKALVFSVGGDIFIPKLPSFKIMDLCAAMDCDKPRVIGIRADEKLHETLMTYEESLTAYEYTWGFVIYPLLHEWFSAEKVVQGGSTAKSIFTYQSGENYIMSVDEIKTRLKELD